MKRFAFILTIILSLVFFTTAYALNLKVERRDMKLATQVIVEKQTITDAILADDNRILDDQATSDTVITTVTSFLAQPDVARVVSVTPGGTTADVPAGSVVVSGTNLFGSSISENITLTANQSLIQHGTTAFLTVTSVVFPIQDGTNSTYDVGVSNTLGVKRCMDNAGSYLKSNFDGVHDSTRGTVIADSSLVEKNTFESNGTLDGVKDIELYFFQTFRCLP